MTILYKNNARSTLATATLAPGDTSMNVASGHGDRFPVVVAPDVAYITLENTGGVREIVKVTARASASDVMTIVRAQDGTSAATWISGDTVAQRVIAKELSAFETLENVDNADSKTTPVDADSLPLKDSAASNGLKRLTWANLKATLKTYFDTLYAKVGAITTGGITMSTARLLGRSMASTGAVEEITVGTGLSLSGGALACTVVADVVSVGGYTGVVTAANLLDAVKTVDGTGSGLDADLFDGQSSAYYAPATGGNYLANDLGAGNYPVGTIALCISTGPTIAAGATSSRVAPIYVYQDEDGYGVKNFIFASEAASGTWRNISGNTLNYGAFGYPIRLCQRIA